MSATTHLPVEMAVDLDELEARERGSRAVLHCGDSLDVLRCKPDNSVDAVVSDPPYGISFLGRRWDYDVPSVELWREVLRVLKPGGHLLAFSGTRTFHRMTVNIEDAGFEIRDMVAWAYGSGFPKSHDVAKAIDKLDARDATRRRRLRFTTWLREQGITSSQINEATGTTMGGHYLTDKEQPQIPVRSHFDAVLPLLRDDIPEWVDALVDERTVESENFAAREVVGSVRKIDSRVHRPGVVGVDDDAERTMRDVDVTLPATDEAREWEGWGTALKPALEPVTLARKPMTPTVARNVLEHGTGAINIDGCRVGDEEMVKSESDGTTTGKRSVAMAGDYTGRRIVGTVTGRWPSNFTHDGSPEVMDLLPDGAARFFYCPKASKKERGEGNVHPTVKPTELMRYLVRLVTPPGGVVLDPFMGSGSTGRAALLEGARFLGIEREPDFFDIARGRVRACED